MAWVRSLSRGRLTGAKSETGCPEYSVGQVDGRKCLLIQTYPEGRGPEEATPKQTLHFSEDGVRALELAIAEIRARL